MSTLWAVLGESVDECDDAGSSGEDGTPLLECEVGRDDGRAHFVAAADDVVENISGAAVAWQIAELRLYVATARNTSCVAVGAAVTLSYGDEAPLSGTVVQVSALP